ncbi:hypothetical protein M2351_005002 [Azospirillum canadense]|nr:hypothetical protein [Azospirillum canadense]
MDPALREPSSAIWLALLYIWLTLVTVWTLADAVIDAGKSPLGRTPGIVLSLLSWFVYVPCSQLVFARLGRSAGDVNEAVQELGRDFGVVAVLP